MPGNVPASPSRYAFPTPAATRPTQPGGGSGAPSYYLAPTAGHPGFGGQATSGRSSPPHHYETIDEDYQNVPAMNSRNGSGYDYGNGAGSAPPLPFRPFGNAIGSNHGQGGASSLAQNQGNGSRVLPSNAQANNVVLQPGYTSGSHAASTTGVRELIRSFENNQQSSSVPVSNAIVRPLPLGATVNAAASNYNLEIASLMAQYHGNRSQVVASNARSNQAPLQPAGYPVGPHAASTASGRELARNFGPVQQNSNEPASNVFVRQQTDFPAQANSVRTRIAELERRGVNLVPGHGNAVQPNHQLSVQDPFGASSRRTAQNNATSAGASNLQQSQDPRDFVLQAPPMPEVSMHSAFGQTTQRFGNSQPMPAYNNMQPAEPHNNARQSQPYGFPQSQYYDPQQGRNYGLQESRNFDQPQVHHYDPRQGQNIVSQQGPIYGLQQTQYGEPQQGRNYGSQENWNIGMQQGTNFGAQQGQNFTSRPFSGPGEQEAYRAEIERLMAHPERTEYSFPNGTPMGLFTTAAGWGFEAGRLQPGTTEVSQFPVGVTSFGTVPYEFQNAQTVSPNQAQPVSIEVIRA